MDDHLLKRLSHALYFKICIIKGVRLLYRSTRIDLNTLGKSLPLIIRHTDLVITKEERDRFERKNGLLSGVIRKNDAALVPTGDNLNHDPELQELANQIANSYFVEHGEHPTKTDVAQIIVGKSYTHLKPDTVVRRIRNNWKN